jgi:hypothetical protein
VVSSSQRKAARWVPCKLKVAVLKVAGNFENQRRPGNADTNYAEMCSLTSEGVGEFRKKRWWLEIFDSQIARNPVRVQS